MKGIKITCIILFFVIAILIAANIFLYVGRDAGDSEYKEIKQTTQEASEQMIPEPEDVSMEFDPFVAKEGITVNYVGDATVNPMDVPDQTTDDQEAAEPVDTTAGSEDSEYIFPDSDSTYLKKSDLKKLSAKKLRLARNELYARHGYIFNDDELYNYFSGKSWYNPTVASEDFLDSQYFNKYEIANRNLIKKVESKK